MKRVVGKQVMAAVVQPQVHLWTRSEYHRMADLDFFVGRRVELVEGQVIEMAAMRSPHAVSIDLADAALKTAFGPEYYIRQQKPFVVSDISEPEPDVAVIKGSVRDFARAHPTESALLVEIADSSLRYGRETKCSLYAKAGVPEYWIVNLVARQLEVHRQPVAADTAIYDFDYADCTIFLETERVTPLKAPTQTIEVATLLP